MDPILVAALAALALLIVWRLRRTYRSARTGGEEEIRRKLAELRKKRDEE